MPVLPALVPRGRHRIHVVERARGSRRHGDRTASQAFAPVVAECDWISPSIYDRHDTRQYPTQLVRDRQVEVYRLRNSAMVELSKAMIAESGPDPIDRSCRWSTSTTPRAGNTVETRKIPREQIVEKQLRPAIEAGADSIAIWTGAGHYAHIATSPPNPSFRLQSQVRDSVRLAYLGGETPDTWVSEAVRAEIIDHFGNTIRQAVEDVVADPSRCTSPLMNAATGP